MSRTKDIEILMKYGSINLKSSARSPILKNDDFTSKSKHLGVAMGSPSPFFPQTHNNSSTNTTYTSHSSRNDKLLKPTGYQPAPGIRIPLPSTIQPPSSCISRKCSLQAKDGTKPKNPAVSIPAEVENKINTKTRSIIKSARSGSSIGSTHNMKSNH